MFPAVTAKFNLEPYGIVPLKVNVTVALSVNPALRFCPSKVTASKLYRLFPAVCRVLLRVVPLRLFTVRFTLALPTLGLVLTQTCNALPLRKSFPGEPV